MVRVLSAPARLVEAACKTLVAQRLKLGGMRWGLGGQAILTPRGSDQSNPFDEAWARLAAHYHADVCVLARVIPFSPSKSARRAPGRMRTTPRRDALAISSTRARWPRELANPG